MNDDLISRQAAIDAILKINDYGNADRANALGLAECAITTLPSAQPKKGKWIYDYDKDEAPFFMQGWKCSACGRRQTYGESEFCMNCGAEMERSDGYEERQRKLRERLGLENA